MCVGGEGGGGERGIGFSNREGGESNPTEQEECTSSACFCDVMSLDYCKTCSQEPVSFLTVRLKCANKALSIK